jgi:hypothetical protein
MKLTLAQRIASYNAAFPNSVSREGNSTLFIHNGRIYGYWVIGNLYKRNFYKNPNGFYGGFPYKFKEKTFAMFMDCKYVLHIFSGTIKPSSKNGRKEITFDIMPELRPTICDDIRNIKKYAKIVSKQDLVLADPMYDKSDFEKHGQLPFSKQKAIRDLGEIMKPKAYLAWLDTRPPIYSKKTWLLVAEIAVRVSTNTRMRVLTIWQKRPKRLD